MSAVAVLLLAAAIQAAEAPFVCDGPTVCLVTTPDGLSYAVGTETIAPMFRKAEGIRAARGRPLSIPEGREFVIDPAGFGNYLRELTGTVRGIRRKSEVFLAGLSPEKRIAVQRVTGNLARQRFLARIPDCPATSNERLAGARVSIRAFLARFLYDPNFAPDEMAKTEASQRLAGCLTEISSAFGAEEAYAVEAGGGRISCGGVEVARVDDYAAARALASVPAARTAIELLKDPQGEYRRRQQGELPACDALGG